MIIGLVVVLSCVNGFPLDIACAAASFKEPPTLRVWLAGASPTPTLACPKACRIMPHDSAARGRLVKRLGPVKAGLAPEGLTLGADLFECDTLDIRAEGDNAIEVDGHAYYGVIRLIRAGDDVAVVNLIDVERYLLGVLGGEMPSGWPIEALKAQAVAARTYALYYHEFRCDAAWDLTSTVEDQVYRSGAPPRKIRDAVAATRGQVLLYDGELFPAFYHSTCGGQTESPGMALGKPEFDFLQGVPCGFCEDSRHYRWQVSLSSGELALSLAAGGFAVAGPITGVAVVTLTGETPDEADGYGRAVRLTGLDGETAIPIVDFRRAVGRMKVRSGKFTCRRDDPAFGGDTVFSLSGRGLGHGAGMCQYGARGMAEAGYSYKRILAHFYRNTDMKKLY